MIKTLLLVDEGVMAVFKELIAVNAVPVIVCKVVECVETV
jgi:hypothetical protein